jgi:pyruvate formate lyase activating enzyme
MEKKEAAFYERVDDGAVRCSLCSFRCRIPEGKRGFCRVRENREGVLYSLVYGRVIARHVDPIEKKPLYHFLPGSVSYSIATPGCNFRCAYCQNWNISQTEADSTFDRISFVPPEQVVGEALAEGALSVSYTYTEPTIFMEYALECADLAHRKGLKNVFVTNGFQTPEAVEAMCGLIDAANVDIKAFSDEFYRRQCQGRLQPVLDSITAMHAGGIFVEATTLLIPGHNDSDDELKGIAEFLVGLSPDIPWHLSRFHPDYRVADICGTPLDTMARAEEIGRGAGLNYVYLGNVVTEHGQNTRCPRCRHTLVERRGLGRPILDISGPYCSACGHPVRMVLG